MFSFFSKFGCWVIQKSFSNCNILYILLRTNTHVTELPDQIFSNPFYIIHFVHVTYLFIYFVNLITSYIYIIVQVARELFRSEAQTRILALSATPGNDLPAVKAVLQELFITSPRPTTVLHNT